MNKIPSIKEYLNEYQSQVVDLIVHIQQKEYQIPITKNDQPDLFNIESFYQVGRGNFWVAMYDEKVIGTISLLDIGNEQTALRKMFVNKDFRGKTFNTAGLLLDEAKKWAKQNSIKEILLGTTLQFIAAHRFYEKNGFSSIEIEDLPKNFPVMK